MRLNLAPSMNNKTSEVLIYTVVSGIFGAGMETCPENFRESRISQPVISLVFWGIFVVLVFVEIAPDLPNFSPSILAA